LKNKIFLQNHIISIFILLAFAWTFVLLGIVILISGVGLDPASLPPWQLIIVFLGGFGPSIVGILVTRMTGNKGTLWKRIKMYKLSGWLYIFALGVIILIAIISMILDSLLGIPVNSTAEMLSILPLALIWPVFSSTGEELGWRGVLLPELQKKYSPFISALVVGILWGLWHFPSYLIALGTLGVNFIPYFILSGPISFIGLSVVMTLVYNKAKGSLFILILMHYTITMTGMLFVRLDLTFEQTLVHSSLSFILYVILGALFIIFNKKEWIFVKS
jgi:membrane protease YdiL (CAAX protease family)